MDWLTDTPFSCEQERGFLLRIDCLAGSYTDPHKTLSERWLYEKIS